jgi:hypothetical protein
MVKCEYCFHTFTTQNFLDKHKNSAKYCIKYRDILFSCCKCNYNTKGIKNIDKHINNCESLLHNKSYEIKNINEFDKQILKYNQTTSMLTDRIAKYELKIKNISSDLKIEKIKSYIYLQIIEQKLGIKINELVDTKKDGIHLYQNDIPIIIHENMFTIIMDDENDPIKKNVKPKKTKKKSVNIQKNICTDKKKIKKSVNIDDDIIIPEKVCINEKIKKSDDDIIIPEKVCIDEKKIKKSVNIDDDIIIPEKKINISRSKTKSVDKSKSPQINTSYRTVRNCVDLVDEKPDHDIKAHIGKIDNKIDKVIYDNFDVSLKEITNQITDKLNIIENNRIYSRAFIDIKHLRNKLLGKLSLTEYSKLIDEHIDKLTLICKNKNFDIKKTNKNISKSLSPLDMRLKHYGSYVNTTIDTDEFHRLRTALEIHAENPKQYKPFDFEYLYNNLFNYTISLFTIKESLTRLLFNRYGFFNLIYVELPKSSQYDPYSFYTLSNICGTTRKWNMNCRIEDLANNLIAHLRPYCMNLFRHIYSDIFKDNDYRQDFQSLAQIGTEDCEQLLQNIIILSRPHQFCQLLQDMIIQNATYKPTEYDKFNLYGDDKLQSKRFANAVDPEEEVICIISQLFDGIKNEQSADILYKI